LYEPQTHAKNGSNCENFQCMAIVPGKCPLKEHGVVGSKEHATADTAAPAPDSAPAHVGALGEHVAGCSPGYTHIGGCCAQLPYGQPNQGIFSTVEVSSEAECKHLCTETRSCHAYEYQAQSWQGEVHTQVCKIMEEPQDYGRNGTMCLQMRCNVIDRTSCEPDHDSAVQHSEPEHPKSCEELGWQMQNGNTEVCGQSGVTGSCSNEKSLVYEQADSVCKAVGARLCTVQELQSDVAQGTGCNRDKEWVWTMTGCTLDGAFEQQQMVSRGAWTKKRPATQCRPVLAATKAAVRCCAHSHGADSVPLVSDDPDVLPATALLPTEKKEPGSGTLIGITSGTFVAVAFSILAVVLILNKRSTQNGKRTNGLIERAGSISKSTSAAMFEWDHSAQEYHNIEVAREIAEPGAMTVPATVEAARSRRAKAQYRSFQENVSDLDSHTDFDATTDDNSDNPASPEGVVLETAGSQLETHNVSRTASITPQRQRRETRRNQLSPHLASV